MRDLPGELFLWDARTGTQIRKFEGHVNVVTGVTFSPDNRLLASRSADQTIRIWDVESGRQLSQIQEVVSSITFRPDGKHLAGTCVDGTARWWDVVSGAERFRVPRSTTKSRAVAFSPNGRWLATTTSDRNEREIQIRNPITGAATITLEGNRGPWKSIIFSPDSHYLAAQFLDGIKVWDVETGRSPFAISVRGGSMAFSPNGQALAVGLLDGMTRIWQLPA